VLVLAELVDFFTACGENSASLVTRSEAILSKLEDEHQSRLLTFMESVHRHGQISINMRPTVLLTFLTSGTLLNIHQWAESILKRSRKTKNAILKDKLGDYYFRRMAFDLYFRGGDAFQYGALIVGGLGLERYGEYCAIFSLAKLQLTSGVGYLASDSLRTYVSSKASLDGERIRTECACDTHKHFLACVKLASKICSAPEMYWNRCLCSDDDYIEAIIGGQVTPDAVRSIRIAKTDYLLYWEYAFNEFAGKLSELDRFRVDTFARIDDNLARFGLTWEPVTDA
jgi:hypothetical protein